MPPARESVRLPAGAGPQQPGSQDASVFDCACFNVRNAARLITSLYDRVLEPSQLKTTQFAILANLNADDQATMQSLATGLGLDPSTMTRTLRPLTDAGLIEVQAGDDRRSKRLTLTSAGRRKLTLCHRLWKQAQDELRERLGRETFERMIGDLAAVANALRT